MSWAGGVGECRDVSKSRGVGELGSRGVGKPGGVGGLEGIGELGGEPRGVGDPSESGGGGVGLNPKALLRWRSAVGSTVQCSAGIGPRGQSGWPPHMI